MSLFTHYIRLLIKKQPVFTIINLLGLVIGISAFLLLFKYVRYEYQYDKNTPNYNNIWRVFNQTMEGNTVTTQDANTHSALGPILKSEVPGVVEYTRLYCGNSPEIVVLVENNPFEVKRFYAADQGFFLLFPQNFLSGNQGDCLKEPYTMVITKSQAVRLFGTDQALGRFLKIKTGMLPGDYKITGIIEDPMPNTHIKFDLLISYQTRYAQGHVDNLESYWDYNYILLDQGVNPQKVRNKLNIINQKLLSESGIRLEIQPFKDIHLKSNLTYELEPNGSKRIVDFLSWVAILILIIAFINYINLSTALANERAKEVGVRKALGASKYVLTRQFLMESLVLSGFALMVSYLLIQWVLPYFESFIGKELDSISPLNEIYFWIISIIIVFSIALITGLITSAKMTNFAPTEVLKGKIAFGKASITRKSLVVFQFTSSVILIISVLVIFAQLRFMRSRDMGIQLDQVITLKTDISVNETLATTKMGILKQKLKGLSEVTQTASSSIVPGQGINTISGSSRPIRWTQKNEFANLTTYYVNTDQDFYDLFQIKILAGNPKLYLDRESRFRHVMINETLLKALGFRLPQEAVGQNIAYQNSENDFSMIIDGVIQDFHIETLKTAPNATIYYCFPPEQLNYLSIKLNAGNFTESLRRIKKIWEQSFPDQPFNYTFLDENFENQYKSEAQFGKVFGLFSLLAIVISCLGLMGLVAFNVQKRTKEIGVRKVLGASLLDLVFLISKEFLALVFISILIASPIAYFIMETWLKDYVYRIKLEYTYFFLAGLFALLISILTIGHQVLKVSFMNPAKSLKTD